MNKLKHISRYFHKLRILSPLILALSFSAAIRATQAESGLLTKEDIDASSSVDIVAGQTKASPALAAGEWLGQSGSEKGPKGFFFGIGEAVGARGFRVGFSREVEIGTVVTRGNGKLSVLRPGAPYPGDPQREADWLPAECARPAQLSVWVLPPATKTRALRWLAEGQPAEAACPDTWSQGPLPEGLVGWFGGLYVFKERLMDVAPYAEVIALTPGPEPERLANGDYRMWRGFGGVRCFWHVWETEASAWSAVSSKPPMQLLYTWTKPVNLVEMGLCFPGVSSARIESYAGPINVNPLEAPESAWVAPHEQPVRSRYPAGFDVEWLGLGKPVATSAVRLTGLMPLAREQVAPDIAGMLGGRRVWLGGWIALARLGDRSPAELANELTRAKIHPPIPIQFSLKEPGFVTLVIEDPQGNRVRNLISETYRPAGENTLWWDGLDDLRAKNIRDHGAYEIDGKLVEAGEYRVRGLVRGQIDLRYEFTVYNPVNPPWRTPDRTGQWISDHRPPSDVLFVPGDKPFMLIGSELAEGAHGLVWTDLEGHKIIGTTALAGFAGAANLARDAGPKRQPDIDAYAVAVWDDILYLRAIQGQSLQPILRPDYPLTKREKTAAGWLEQGIGWRERGIAGLAAYNRTLVVSAPREGGLLVVDTVAGKGTGKIPLSDPRGVAFTANGDLLCVTTNGVLRIPAFNPAEPPQKPAIEMLVSKGLEDPCGIALDQEGNLYVSDRGESHQVKVFSPRGKLLRTVGKAGRPAVGPYDELHMNNPAGLTVTNRGELWVAEEDLRPKRVSVWTPQGEFLRASYGPSRYGGGGHLDPRDKTRFYYEGMEFRLDWENGTDRLLSVYHRPDRQAIPDIGDPETPIYVGGQQYMVNVFSSNPTSGPKVGGVWLMREGRAQLVAAVGVANTLKALQTPEILERVPKSDQKDKWGNPIMDITKPLKYGCYNPVSFAWSDLNLNGKIDPEEITFATGEMGPLNITKGLAFVGALATVLSPAQFTKEGVPVYEIAQMKTLIPDAQMTNGSAGDQVTLGSNGDIALTMPLKRDPCHAGFSGVTTSGSHWFYPNKWPGLHASQTARPGRIPDPGEMIGTTRVLGLPVTPKGGSDAGELWGVNANSGVLYLFTTDGLFVTSLFKNGWISAHQGAFATRNMLLNDASTEGESFWPTICQTADGTIYLTAVEHTSSLVRVDGLESIRRLPPWTLTVTPKLIEECQQYEAKAEAERVFRQGRKELTVALCDKADERKVDGELADWSKDADWVTVDSGTRAALAVAGDRLFVAYHTTHPDLLKNAGSEPWQALFKSGGGLDIMLATRRADGKPIDAPVEGDVRLIVSQVDGKTRALLYRPVVTGTPAADRVPFSSPSRTIYFDKVTDVSPEVELAISKPYTRPPWVNPDAQNVSNGTSIEFSIPLKTLGLSPRSGLEIPGDIGILKGDGSHTTFRACWHNQATGLTQDVPGEALLTPSLWGRWRFQ